MFSRLSFLGVVMFNFGRFFGGDVKPSSINQSGCFSLFKTQEIGWENHLRNDLLLCSAEQFHLVLYKDLTNIDHVID